MRGAAPPLVITGGSGSTVTTADGRTLVDLAMGFGSAFLGHGHPAIAARLAERARGPWNCSRLPTPAHARVEALLARLLPPGFALASLYSTGMEAVEYALRVAATHTGRQEFAGFARGMHGKSAMTASLCWGNAPMRMSTQHILPFVDQGGESSVLEGLEALLRTGRLAALLIEPIQGSNGAHRASDAFYREAIAACHRHGALCIFDEILTGLYRTGPAFFVERLGVAPDLVIFAKCMGNGFPASAVAAASPVRLRPEALPGSTFSGNPLALAAIEGTLEVMASLDMPGRVAAIEQVVRSSLATRLPPGASLRGAGALWCIELAPGVAPGPVYEALVAEGVLVSAAGRSIRLLPAATIEPEVLRRACGTIVAACLEPA